MKNREVFDFFMEQLLENAVLEFKGTPQYELLQEKMEQMNRDCESMLRPDERDFVTECFERILEVDAQEETYVFCKAFRDCVSVLKWIGVLA